MSITKKRAVFIDRDGTINEGGRCDRAPEFRLLPGVREGMALLRQSGFELIVVTNQSALGEDNAGHVVWKQAPLDRHDLAEIFAKMNRLLGPEAQPDAIKFCPHAYWIEDCPCHKPKPGMILEAAAEMDIDLCASFFIGDRADDVLAAHAAGVKPIMVMTGEDPQEALKVSPEIRFLLATNFLEAAHMILEQNNGQP